MKEKAHMSNGSYVAYGNHSAASSNGYLNLQSTQNNGLYTKNKVYMGYYFGCLGVLGI